jgi:single-stranded DNA-binding protein
VPAGLEGVPQRQELGADHVVSRHQYLEKGSQVFVKGELRGEAVDGTQNPRIWTGNDGEARTSYELTARTVKFLGRRDNGGAPIGEPPPGGEDDDVLPF